MRIAILNGDNTYHLQKRVNEFLKDIDDSQIIDIKYQGVGNHPTHSIDYPSVMIIMK